MTELQTNIKKYQQRVNDQLTKHILHADIQSELLNKTMAHGALLGGKRIRPFLVYCVGEMLGTKVETLDAIACSVEAIHAYSLIHDDLPAMDDDNLRRGQPTCHIAFNEASAILAGDALQALAFEMLATPIHDLTAKQQLKMVALLAKASGDKGMCAGQSLDLEAENKQVTLVQLEKIHNAKTGALIKVAVELAALSKKDLPEKEYKLLQNFAAAIGLAFQVQDDILDIISDTETLGKPQGSDIALHKSTYPALLGLDNAIERSNKLIEEANEALSALPYDTSLLALFSQYIIKRDR